NYELISPTKYETIALIENAINDVLSKPSILIDNIVSRLTDDLDYRKDAFYEKDKEFAEYLNKYYFSHLNEKQKWKLFKNLWKFCFCKENDEKCNINREINTKALVVLTENFLITHWEENEFSIANNDRCTIAFAKYLSNIQYLYNRLPMNIKTLIDHLFDRSLSIKFIAYWKYKTADEHFSDLRVRISAERIFKGVSFIRRFIKHYFDSPGKDKLIEFLINLYAESGSFDVADNRFSVLIQPYLKEFNDDNLRVLLEKSNENYQIYARRRASDDNEIILSYAKKVLGEEYNFAQYQNLNLVDTTSTEELAQVEDDKISF
ncbi:MAG: hypothetical protein MJ032_03260, partial [Acidaminococcaceae bacterium]|nr:hypothetical protein [Acidaminococcaceae bacterium]